MRHTFSQRRSDGGFTLIEVMVVIAIIATLIGASSLMLSIAQKKRYVQTTQGRINGLGAALEQIKSQDQLGRYPPTRIGKLSFGGFDGTKFGGEPNSTNVGIEAIYAVFRIPGISVKPQGLDEEDAIGNTDDDRSLLSLGAKSDLFEYMDAWGNPLIYISASDYKDVSKVAEYVLGNGEHVTIEPPKNEKTGEFIRSDSFLLMSLGPDGKPGTGDEIYFGAM